MTILVTGCAGFIGSHLCEALIHKNINVIGLDNFDKFYSRDIKKANIESLLLSDKFTFYELDLCNKKELETIAKDFDVVVHLAAKAGVRPSIQDPAGYMNANI